MTPRERWLALLSGERPDRVVTDYWATPEVTERLCRELRCPDREALYTRLSIDGVVHVDPPRIVRGFPGDARADIWGLRRRRVAYGAGAYDEFDNHPLAAATTVREIEGYPWPRAADHDFDAFRAALAAAPPHRAVCSGEYEPFLLYCALRGMEQAMMDLLVEPDIVRAALARVFRYHYETNARIFDIGRGRIDLFYLAEDLGGQTNLLIGLPQIREFLLPHMREMAGLAKSHGIRVFYHTDGAARAALPDLVDVVGIDILNPIQWRCPGMDREGLVRDFGGRVVFHGAMDNQRTLPFGTADDVRAEVLDNLRVFAGARWVCAPCHNLQPVTPTENILALYETIHAHGLTHGA